MVSDNNLRLESVCQTHKGGYIGEKSLHGTFGNLLGGPVASKQARKAGASVDHTTVVLKLVRVAGSEGPRVVKVEHGARGRNLRGVAQLMERERAGTSTCNSINNAEVETKASGGGQPMIDDHLTRMAPGVLAWKAKTLPEEGLRH